MTVIFSHELSLLPVSAQEVGLISAHLGDLLQRMLMHSEED